MKQTLLDALEAKYESDIQMADATLQIYLTNSVGIGEHAQHLDEIDKLVSKIAEAKDKLEVLKEFEPEKNYFMIKGDSGDYKYLARWTKELKPQDFHLTLEIGVREGYSSNIIMEMLQGRNHFHIGVDPYGDLVYKHLDKQDIIDDEGRKIFWTDFDGNRLVNPDGSPKVPTYPNTMKQNFFSDFKYHENFTLFQLEDTEYFNAFGRGVPIYKDGKKKIINTYDLVFFDGPHTTDKVMEEAIFFAPRSRIGTRFIFDDLHAYEMSIVAYALTIYGFKTIEVGNKKNMLRETDVAYLAGLFDGEGSVQYKQYMRKRSHGKKAYPTWSIRLELAMTEKSTVKWIHDFTGCGSFGERKVQPGRKRQWRWRCSHRDAFYVACLMWPYSHTKLSMLNKILQHYDFWKEKNVINMEDWKYANMERKV